MRYVFALCLAMLAMLALVMCQPVPPAPTPLPQPSPGIVFGPGSPMDVSIPHVIVARDDYDGEGYNIAGITLGAHKDVTWSAVNPADGVYRWSGVDTCSPQPCTPPIDGIDDYLAAIANQTVTLASGEVVSRTAWFTLPMFWAQHPSSPNDCANYVPAWLKVTAPDHVIAAYTPVPPTPAATPNWQQVPGLDYQAFTDAYSDLLFALADHIQNDLTPAQRAQIAGFFVPGGYNNENHIEAAYCNLRLNNSPLGAAITKSEWWTFYSQAVQAFQDALAPYPAYVLMAAHTWQDQRCQLETLLLSYDQRRLGWGFNGMLPDLPAYYTDEVPPVNSSAGCGAFDVMQRTLGVLPVKFEPSLSYQTDYQRMYWSWLLALGGFWADVIDTQDEWFEAPGGTSNFAPLETTYGFPDDFYQFILRQLGDTTDTAQDLWVAFHTTEYPRHDTGYNAYECEDALGNSYCHGYEGNITHGMAVKAGSVDIRCSVYRMPSCQDAGLPTHSGASPDGSSTNPYSRHAGLLTSATTTLEISPTVGYYGDTLNNAVIRVAWIGDDTGDLEITYATTAGGASDTEVITRVNDGAWHWTTISPTQLYVGNTLASGGIIDITHDGDDPTLHMVWLDLSANDPPDPGSTPTPTATPGPTPTVTPTPDLSVPPVFHFTEYSAVDRTHDWFPDSLRNDGDLFVELYSDNTYTVTAESYALEVVAGATGLRQSYVFSDSISPQTHYILWNHDMGLALPVTGTLTLTDDDGNLLASGEFATSSDAAESWQLCSAGWQSDLPTPGWDCGYWTPVPTPTPWPTRTQTPTRTPTPTITPTITPTPTSSGSES